MTMVGIETAWRRQPLGRLQLSAREPIFAAGACLQRQPGISPELSFSLEAMRGLEQSDQKRDSDWAQQRNLSKKRMAGMLLAFCQQLPPHLPPYRHQSIELLIKLLRVTTYACFRQLFQPTAAVAR